MQRLCNQYKIKIRLKFHKSVCVKVSKFFILWIFIWLVLVSFLWVRCPDVLYKLLSLEIIYPLFFFFILQWDIYNQQCWFIQNCHTEEKRWIWTATHEINVWTWFEEECYPLWSLKKWNVFQFFFIFIIQIPLIYGPVSL